ncbi:unnamed protein product, partial [Choristocarpus tenellus]
KLHKDGRPVLIGTTNVAMSDLTAIELEKRGILNANPDLVERESEIVGQAGRLGVVTVATNMAGRGTDILLGGNPSVMARIRVRDALAEKLLGAEDLAVLPQASFHFAWSNGVGATFYPCDISDDAAAALATATEACLRAMEPGSVPREALEELVSAASEAGPVSGEAAEAVRSAIREVRVSFASSLEEEKKEVLDLGGLYVVGTARHESRRIDNQLRGRAGRQGDPGATRFFLSLEDDIFR